MTKYSATAAAPAVAAAAHRTTTVVADSDEKDMDREAYQRRLQREQEDLERADRDFGGENEYEDRSMNTGAGSRFRRSAATAGASPAVGVTSFSSVSPAQQKAQNRAFQDFLASWQQTSHRSYV